MIITPKGHVFGIIRYEDRVERIHFSNLVLNSGKSVLASSLVPNSKSVYIKNMLFGDGGCENGKAKEVAPEMNKMFGVVRLKEEVVSQINPDNSTQLILTVNISKDKGNDFSLNEMALELSDGSLFSLATFQNFNKTNKMSIDWIWMIWMV